MNAILSYAWKTLACAVAYFVGSAIGGGLATATGMGLPALPSGAPASELALASSLSSLILGASLGPLAARLRAGYLLRVAILWLLTYVCLAVNTALEMSIFMTVGGRGGMLVVFLPATLACAAAAAALFRPKVPPESAAAVTAQFAGQFGPWSWLWRVAAAVLAFPVVYLAFGMMAGPFVLDAYHSGTLGLKLPPMGTIISMQFLRSTLFLIASLPAIAFWRGSRLRLALNLGLVHYVFVGLFGMLQAFWMPARLRVAHGLEIGADSFAYAALLVLLLARRAPAGTTTAVESTAA